MIINNVGDVLEATALHIEEHGWLQRQFINSTGAACVMGALKRVEAQSLDTRYGIYHADAIRAIIGIIGHDTLVVVWNDYHCKSQEQAVEMLRRAAKLARETEDTQ